MSMETRKAQESDMKVLCRLFEDGIADMEKRGLDQWRWEVYPNETVLAQDLEDENLYLMLEDDSPVAAFTINQEQPPQYDSLVWHLGVRPAAMHRLVVASSCQGRGVGKAAMAEVMRIAGEMGCDCLRLDTYSRNLKAMALYERIGMRNVGKVYFDERITPYECYEIAVTENCPLLPLKMRPAFRHGKDTPWGGDNLKRLFGKDIPDDRTGESMEMSVIPGQVSRTLSGEGLDELLLAYGEKVQGTAIKGPFPLLLKLLDAREALSVQVHPTDAYAAANEGGKLGKTEAWIILSAAPDAELVYGIMPGTTREQLEEAVRLGAAVEPLLRRVKVKEGDVCFIPAGCVHAIGAGIVLYEIQQSSDVTYRFYDWDRQDEKGEKRPLHIEKALDVTDLDFQLEPVPRTPDKGAVRLLENDIFTLDRLHVSSDLVLPCDPRHFSCLTALSTLLLTWEGDALELKKGDTVLLPALRPKLTLQGVGEAILAAPRV